MPEIDTVAPLEAFRRFLIYSTCYSFIPESYLRDREVFPERSGEGTIYVEAVDKATLKAIRDITFVNAREVLGIVYTSKSNNSKLKWRQIKGNVGRVTGQASPNALVNLVLAKVITQEYATELLKKGGIQLELKKEEAGSPSPLEEDASSA